MFSLSHLFRRKNRPQPSVPHRPVVGLDIGFSAIKVAELQRGGKQWSLNRCGIQPLPPEAVVDGQIKQPEVVTQAIRELLAANNITTKQAAISLGGSSVITKKIQMPVMSELELEDQIAMEAEEYIPFDIENVNLDFHILGQNNETMEILLTACKKDLILSHSEAVRQAGLEPLVCDLDLFCLVNAYQTFLQPYPQSQARALAFNPSPAEGGPSDKQPSREPVVILVNMGAAFINIAIVTANGLPGYIRDHALGGRQIVHEIKTRQSLPWVEAERMLIMPGEEREHHSESASWQTELIDPFLEQVVQQIRQAISFHKTGNPDHPVTAVWLAGGCSLLPNATRRIGERLELPLYLADPFANLTHRWCRDKKESPATALLKGMAPRFMVALGLALRGDRP
ncbi:MAG: type IV pilus assembly protein PilM [Magnetococcales bacterium]|nr:type IV pilus assembly protein PilM [Magnetococcales bacterium]